MSTEPKKYTKRGEKSFRRLNSASKFHDKMKGRLGQLSASSGSDAGLDKKRSKTNHEKSDAIMTISNMEDLRLASSKSIPPRFRGLDKTELAIEKSLQKNDIVRGIKTIHLRKGKKIPEKIIDYYYKPHIKPRGFSYQALKDMHFGFIFVLPLLLVGMYEYFLGSQLAQMLWNLSSSRSIILIESVQFVPLIINIRHYKMLGDVEDLSYYPHLYFHSLSFMFCSESVNKVIQMALIIQLVYVINLMWKYVMYSSQQALVIIRTSFMFLVTVLFVDVLIRSTWELPQVSDFFRGFVLVTLQAFRYFPQISFNLKQNHCAVQSVEAHLLALLPALGKVYLSMFEINPVDFIGYAFSVASNGFLAYQIVLMNDNSKAYLEREALARSKLPKVEDKLTRRSFSLKFKHGNKNFADILDEEETDEDDRTVFSDTPSGQKSDFKHGPMI